jgi:hypothetical protein
MWNKNEITICGLLLVIGCNLVVLGETKAIGNFFINFNSKFSVEKVS